jgi:hypothetical protein
MQLFEQLSQSQFVKFKKGDGYKVDVQTPIGNSFFFFHNRNQIPIIKPLSIDNLTAPIPEDAILDYGAVDVLGNRVRGFEILEHNELLLILSQLQLEGLDLSRTIIWNFDNHHDMHDPFTLDYGIWIQNWVCAAKEFDMFNNEDRRKLHQDLGMGMFWVMPPGINYGIKNQRVDFKRDWRTDEIDVFAKYGRGSDMVAGRLYTGVNISQVALDEHFLKPQPRTKLFMPKPHFVLSHIKEAKKHGFNIIVSFDLDIGNTSAAFRNRFYVEENIRWDSRRERFNMFNNHLIRELCANSAAVVVCHSPGYAPVEYAHHEALVARQSHLEGYQIAES